MTQEEKNIDLIEAFYEGRLKGDALTSFIKKRDEDPAFNEEVEDYLLIFGGIKKHGETAFKETLQGWEKEIAADTPSKVLPLYRIMAIAATLLILIIPLSYWILSDSSDNTNEGLFMAYFDPYDDVVSVRSSEVNNLELGMNAYNEGNYEKAIEHLKQVDEKNTQKSAAELYLGISYLATDQLSEAEKVLYSLSQQETDLFKEVAEWNLALLYLKTEKQSLLEEALSNILNQEDHLFKAKAEKLKSELP